ncbi:amino acid transporter [Seiridium cupressi]
MKIQLFLAVCSLASALPKLQAPACTEIAQRVPWTNLTAEEKSGYIGADLCLINSPSKTNFSGATSYIHGVAAFLPFHRYYMTVHERMIRHECSYTGRMPYWDEVAEVDDLLGPDLWKDANFGGDGEGEDDCIQTGPFANLTLRWELNNGVEDHCLSRSFSQHQFSQAAQTNIDRCNAIDDFSTARSCLEGSPHSAGHGGVALVIRYSICITRTSTSYGGSGRSWIRRTDSTICPDPSVDHAIVDYFNDNGTVTTLQHTLYMDGIGEIAPNITINDIMDLNGPVICSEYVKV